MTTTLHTLPMVQAPIPAWQAHRAALTVAEIAARTATLTAGREVLEILGLIQPEPEPVTPPAVVVTRSAPIDLNEARRLYDTGLSLMQVARQMRVGNGRLGQAMREAGLVRPIGQRFQPTPQREETA